MELIVHASISIIELMVHEEKARKDFSDRLALACEKAGLQLHGRQAYIAKKMKLTPKAVSKWFNGEAIPRRGKLQDLAAILGTSGSFLLGEISEGSTNVEHLKIHSDIYRIDVLDLKLSAGPGTYISSEHVDVLYGIEFTNNHARELFSNRRSEDIKVMTVCGDSMSPSLTSGDRLFFDISVRQFITDGIYAFVFGKTFYVKRLQMQGIRLAVLSDNPTYETWYVEEKDQDQLYIMGKALIHESVKYNKV
ncbi:LexA family transcriptional regulator [Enterobacter cloacae]|uniref:LexA family transcriptional regulator n=1 Tax=Enterobacter cloacae TaxID=550 RepID=UPI0029DBBA40|nr:LexA family transcriptional regulator [Enterobacter cloacae]MDX7021994.1 LexA family transcriptional regulator [Enterobacter cloacae]